MALYNGWPKFGKWLSNTGVKPTQQQQLNQGAVMTVNSTYYGPTPSYVSIQNIGGGGGGSGSAIGGGAGGSGAIIGGGTLYGGGGTYTIPQITYGGSALTLPDPLTQQEKDELAALKEQHHMETKAIKIQKFRELHPELRQMIIGMMVWQDKKEEISGTQAEKSTRLQELEMKEQLGKFNMSSYFQPYNGFHVTPVVPPDGLTKEDLMEAHTTATFEEELLKDESDV